MVDIKKLVKKLSIKYGTKDPFEISDYLEIIVICERLGSIGGYYQKINRIKCIHINSDLPDQFQKFICAHELGHALLHPNNNMPFLLNNTLISSGKTEKEADQFAMELLVPDEIILENWYLSIEQLSMLLEYDKHLIELRLETYRKL